MRENPAQELFHGLSRRHFLKASAAATLAALQGAPRLFAGATKPEPKADTLILIWMAGGMAQTETFYVPKPEGPGRISPAYPVLTVLKIYDAIRDVLADVAARDRGIIQRDDGPLWYRGLAMLDEPALEAHVRAVLASYQVERVVVGHTIAHASPYALERSRWQGNCFSECGEVGFTGATGQGRNAGHALNW